PAVFAAVATIILKGGAYFLTGSVAILSDAAESLVNLVTSVVALVALRFAALPADEEHAYGHTKVEYFASGFEGAVILVAAASIAFAAVPRLIDPVPLTAVPLGVAASGVASVINFAAARLLFGAARRFHSITLESGAHHLMVDVWTSVAVIAGLLLSSWLGWVRLDPIIGLLVTLNIVRTGVDRIRRSLLGLLDTALPEPVREEIWKVLEEERPAGVEYHAVRTRQAGAWAFISMHVLVPGHWTVQRGHDYLEDLEERLREAVRQSTIVTHIAPVADPASWSAPGLRR